jgi:hypothetical protein
VIGAAAPAPGGTMARMDACAHALALCLLLAFLHLLWWLIADPDPADEEE